LRDKEKLNNILHKFDAKSLTHLHKDNDGRHLDGMRVSPSTDLQKNCALNPDFRAAA
jgi:hypothetical protein